MATIEELKKKQGYGIRTTNPLEGNTDSIGSYGGEQTQILGNGNSMMPTNPTGTQGMVPEIGFFAGATPASPQLGLVRKPLQLAQQTARPLAGMDASGTPMASYGGITASAGAAPSVSVGGLGARPSATQPAVSTAPLGVGKTAMPSDTTQSGTIGKTSNIVQDSSTQQNTPPVSAVNVAGNTPSQSNGALVPGTGYIETNGKRTNIGTPAQPNQGQGLGISRQQYDFNGDNAAQISAGSNVFNPAAQAAVANSERLINQEGGGIGAGIVSRGMANRAKSFADMSNADDASKANVQNSNTNSKEGASRNAARGHDAAMNEQKGNLAAQESALGARRTNSLADGQDIENAQKNQLAALQAQYLNKDGTDKSRATALQQLNALSGRADHNSAQILKSVDENGLPIQYAAYDKRTGQQIQAQGTQMADSGISPSEIIGKKFASGELTREEASKQLQALGYTK